MHARTYAHIYAVFSVIQGLACGGLSGLILSHLITEEVYLPFYGCRYRWWGERVTET